MTKSDAYAALVTERKDSRLCCSARLVSGGASPCLLNPGDPQYRHLDSTQIGPWTRWQGNLDADVMIIAQDWGDTRYYEKYAGQDAGNPTNERLITLLRTIGIEIDRP
jgi:hypothetical protein